MLAMYARTQMLASMAYMVASMTSFVVIERFWCQCCGTTEQTYRYEDRDDALAELDLKHTLHAHGKCCGSCTRTAWIEHGQDGAAE